MFIQELRIYQVSHPSQAPPLSICFPCIFGLLSDDFLASNILSAYHKFRGRARIFNKEWGMGAEAVYKFDK